MALVFQVGQHSDFPPVPSGFPKCGSFSTRAAVRENEVPWSYNSTKTPQGPFTLIDWWLLGGHNSAPSNTVGSLVLYLLHMLLFSPLNML